MRFLFLLLVLSVSGAWANPPDRYANYRLVHDFTHAWMMYDHDEEVYLPYRFNGEKEFQTYSLLVDLARYPHASLVVKTPPKGASIFMDNALVQVSSKQEWLTFAVDSLRRAYQKDSLWLTFFADSPPAAVTAYIGFPAARDDIAALNPSASNREVVRLTPRELTRHGSGIAVAFVLSLIVVSFVSNNYFRVYGKYYSLRDVLSTRVREDLFIIGKPLDRPSLFFVILLAVVLGFLILLLQFGGLHLVEDNYIFQTGNTVSVHVANFLKLSLVVFIAYVVKFFFISITGRVFNLGKMTDLHYFKVIQCSLFFYSLLLLAALVLYNSYIPLPENTENYLFILVAIFYTGRAILIYFTINRESNVKFLYLFSYLCIAEALPIVLGMRWVFL